MKKFSFLILTLFISSMSLFAQNHEKSDFEFKFLPVNNMFFFEGNEDELARLHKAVDNHINEIRKGDIILNVDGYSSAFGTDSENMVNAKNRSNQVKSDLIVKKGLKEANYSTRNHVASYNGHASAVVVKFHFVNKKEEPKKEPAPVVKEEPVTPKKEEPKKEEPKREEPVTPQPIPVVKDVVVEEIVVTKPEREGYNFALRTNLLHWVALTPNVGVELRIINQRIGLLFNYDWADWTWKNDSRRHKINMTNPEIRYYMGDARNWYIGVESHHAWFTIQYNDDLARLGHLNGGGLVGGYRWDISKCFGMDFNLGVGYTKIHADKSHKPTTSYLSHEHVNSKGYVVPNQATVALVWKLF